MRKLALEAMSLGGKATIPGEMAQRKNPYKELMCFVFILYLLENYNIKTNANTKCTSCHASSTNLLRPYRYSEPVIIAPSLFLFSSCLFVVFQIMTLVQFPTLTVLFPVLIWTLLPWHHFRNDSLTQNPVAITILEWFPECSLGKSLHWAQYHL